MPEFLVHAIVDIPPGFDEATRRALYSHEWDAAQPFFDAHMITRIWREAGTHNHYALWDAASADIIHRAYETFPLWQAHLIRKAEIIPLAVNPKDPVYRASHPEARSEER